MSAEWAAKRFWTAVTVEPQGDGWSIRLDGRALATPAKAPLMVPTRALALAIADEWAAQEGRIRPDTMPATRTANSAIDKVAPQRTAVEAAIAAYGDTDLLCYRARAPEGLVARQAARWDPLLGWAETRFGARLRPVAGVMPRPQEPEALARLAAPMAKMNPHRLAAFHDLVSLTGSLVLGLAAGFDHAEPEALWDLSRLDEDWQAEAWGRDDEAEAAAAYRRAAFLDAARLFALAG